MTGNTTFYDFAVEQPLPSPSRNSFSSSTESTGLSFWDPTYTPITSPLGSERHSAIKSSSDIAVTLDLQGPVTISFTKGSKLFKLKYAKIDVCKDTAGGVRCIELNESLTSSGPFVHTFTSSRRPIPHLELPATPTQRSVRVSFLEDQTIQAAQTIFTSQPQYTFEKASDCNKFQEAVLGQSLMFVAGIAEISSKSRGEEAISQNLRIVKSSSGSLHMIFFANAQRKEKQRYTSIPLDSVESAEQPKKSSKPVQMKLSSTHETAAQLKTLSITFLDFNDAKRFCGILQGSDIPVKTR